MKFESGSWLFEAVAIIGAVLVAAGITAVFATILYVLWNWVIPAFGGPEISWWLALGISLLGGFIFGALGKAFKK